MTPSEAGEKCVRGGEQKGMLTWENPQGRCGSREPSKVTVVTVPTLADLDSRPTRTIPPLPTDDSPNLVVFCGPNVPLPNSDELAETSIAVDADRKMIASVIKGLGGWIKFDDNVQIMSVLETTLSYPDS